jgi:hypothetical protein
MKKHKDSELLKRIARLVKQNKELNEQVRHLSYSNDQLANWLRNMNGNFPA